MSDASLLALSVGGFFGGMLVISRTLGWLVGLLALLRPPRAGASASTRAWPVALLLHSGPWLLALAVAAFVRVAALPWPALGALGGGFGVALAVVAISTGRALWRHRHPSAPRPPLTPERLAEKRHEYFFLSTAGGAIISTAFAGWKFWPTLDRDYPIVIVLVFVTSLAAYVHAVITWPLRVTELEVAEKKRLQREARAARTTIAQPVPVPTHDER